MRLTRKEEEFGTRHVMNTGVVGAAVLFILLVISLLTGPFLFG